MAFLEMSRPLNRVAAQALYFFHPVASLALTGDDYNRFARIPRKVRLDRLSVPADRGSRSGCRGFTTDCERAVSGRATSAAVSRE